MESTITVINNNDEKIIDHLADIHASFAISKIEESLPICQAENKVFMALDKSEFGFTIVLANTLLSEGGNKLFMMFSDNLETIYDHLREEDDYLVNEEDFNLNNEKQRIHTDLSHMINAVNLARKFKDQVKGK